MYVSVTMPKVPTKNLYKILDPHHPVKVAGAVQNFNTYENFTDLCFICAEGVKVKAHKLLLCSLSPQMKAVSDFLSTLKIIPVN